jgi:hypothetical protein
MSAEEKTKHLIDSVARSMEAEGADFKTVKQILKSEIEQRIK